MHTTLEQRQQRGYERFEENRRFEEKTDIAERLGYPIDVTIHYALRDGAVFALSDTVERPFHSQTLQAQLAGEYKFNGDQAFERIRLSHEHNEALMVDKLATGELAGNVLIKFSKVPDAVVENRTSIKGYRRDLLRSFVRIYYRTEAGVSCRLFTLDHNVSTGIHRVGTLIDIDTMQPSEVVLGNHALIDVPDDPEHFVNDLTERVITEYDAAVCEESGQRTHAGSLYADHLSAMRSIDEHPHLLAQHFDSIGSIIEETERERAREQIAAAIKLASEGYSITSSSDAAVAAEVARGNYGGECATATTTGMNQAGQVKNMENVWSHGECQVCFAKTSVGSCRVCRSCSAADDSGVDLLKLRERNLRRRAKIQQATQIAVERTDTKNTLTRSSKQKTDTLTARYGAHAMVSSEVVIGGAKQVVRDRRTKELLSR